MHALTKAEYINLATLFPNEKLGNSLTVMYLQAGVMYLQAGAATML